MHFNFLKGSGDIKELNILSGISPYDIPTKQYCKEDLAMNLT